MNPEKQQKCEVDFSQDKSTSDDSNNKTHQVVDTRKGLYEACTSKPSP